MKKILKIILVAVLVLGISRILKASTIFNFDIEQISEFENRDLVNEIKNNVNNFQIYRDDRLIVKLKNEHNFRTLSLSQGIKVSEAINSLRQNPEIEYVEPDYYAYAQFIPNDPYYKYQWNFNNNVYGGINLESAWDLAQGQSVVIAVIDTGVAYENYNSFRQAPDLVNTQFVAGYDFIENDFHPNDDNGHGTHVVGTIAQSTNNKLGVAGVAYMAKIMPIKALDRKGIGSYSAIANAIRYAADNGAHIINLSLGGPSHSQALLDAVRYAYSKGVFIVAAAGNDGKEVMSYPAAYDEYVMSVGATRFDERLSYYSNYGSSLDIVAPGGDLKVDQNNDGYGDGILQQTIASNNPRKFGYYFYQGTSMATPHVAGVAGLIRSLGISSPQQIRDILIGKAKDLGEPGFDKYYGYGRLDAAASINEVLRLVNITTQNSQPNLQLETTNQTNFLDSNTSENSGKNFISKISITDIYVSNFDAGRRVRVGFRLENGNREAVTLLAKGQILDEDNNLVSWGNFEDMTLIISGNRSKIAWFERLFIPENIDTRNYILEIILVDESGNSVKTSKDLAYQGTRFKIKNFISDSILTKFNKQVKNILTNSESVIELLNKKI